MNKTRLSVNVNKFATLRNARGGNNPNLLQVVKDCIAYGAEGITVHPRPDERHIRYQDVYDIASAIDVEFNIEGNPIDRFMDLVLSVCPTQATLVPDGDDAITSNAGWDTIKNKDFLKEVISNLQQKGIRVSIFIDPDPNMLIGAKEIGSDRIEMYTESYAKMYPYSPQKAIQSYVDTAKKANELGIQVNAGHDLDLKNLSYFQKHIPNLMEVSIGHALVCDALYLGLEKTISAYKSALD